MRYYGITKSDENGQGIQDRCGCGDEGRDMKQCDDVDELCVDEWMLCR